MKVTRKLMKFIHILLDTLNSDGIQIGEMEDDTYRVEGKYIGYNLINLEIKIKEHNEGRCL